MVAHAGSLGRPYNVYAATNYISPPDSFSFVDSLILSNTSTNFGSDKCTEFSNHHKLHIHGKWLHGSESLLECCAS